MVPPPRRLSAPVSPNSVRLSTSFFFTLVVQSVEQTTFGCFMALEKITFSPLCPFSCCCLALLQARNRPPFSPLQT